MKLHVDHSKITNEHMCDVFIIKFIDPVGYFAKYLFYIYSTLSKNLTYGIVCFFQPVTHFEST
jgi:hypothetical protein